jgi:hypothetical protein
MPSSPAISQRSVFAQPRSRSASYRAPQEASDDLVWKKVIVHFTPVDLSALFVAEESDYKIRESNMRDFLSLLKAIVAGVSRQGARRSNSVRTAS